VETESVGAVKFIRSMRGGSQAQLLSTTNQKYHVTKARFNPQGQRTLINEWITTAIFDWIHVLVPRVRPVLVEPAVLLMIPLLRFGSRWQTFGEGPHLGSEFPGDPERVTVYDFLPTVLLRKHINVHDFAGALVCHKWLGNTDRPQAIFFRAAAFKNWSGSPLDDAQSSGFLCEFIDHGYCFGGPEWSFTDSPATGVYHDLAVYDLVTGWDSLTNWIEAIHGLPESVLWNAVRSAPREWVSGEEGNLERLIGRLFTRRKRLPQLIADAHNGDRNPFRNWNGTSILL